MTSCDGRMGKLWFPFSSKCKDWTISQFLFHTFGDHWKIFCTPGVNKNNYTKASRKIWGSLLPFPIPSAKCHIDQEENHSPWILPSKRNLRVDCASLIVPIWEGGTSQGTDCSTCLKAQIRPGCSSSVCTAEHSQGNEPSAGALKNPHHSRQMPEEPEVASSMKQFLLQMCKCVLAVSESMYPQETEKPSSSSRMIDESVSLNKASL